MSDIKSAKEELLRKIEKYSNYKYRGMLPGFILIILGTLVFFVAVIVNIFTPIHSLWVLIPCGVLIFGIALVTIALLLSEKIRDRILKYDVKDFLRIITEDESTESVICLDSLYYDLIEVLRYKLNLIFHAEEVISKNVEEACNCLRLIMRENATAGLANRMVYDNRNAFREICKIILDKSDGWNTATDSKDVLALYQKNKNIKGSDYKEEKRKRRRTNVLRNIGIIKNVFLVGCTGTLIAQGCTYKGDWISLVFNFVAVALLFIDLIERKLKEKTT